MSDLIEREAALKPCPFCGSPAGWMPEGNHFIVGCGTCNGQVSRLDKADAISNWNRRSALPSSPAAGTFDLGAQRKARSRALRCIRVCDLDQGVAFFSLTSLANPCGTSGR